MNGFIVKNVRIYSPEPMGSGDVFIFGGKIAKTGKHISWDAFKECGCTVQTIDGTGLLAVPGFIDQHVHFNGAGGEGGPLYRTPPTPLSVLIKAGITTAIGLLGTDGFTRSLRELLMKARSLESQGITTKIFTGAYQIPGPVLTSDIASDIILIDKVIGLKIAYSDHRSSHAGIQTLRETVSQARVGGILSGKSGAVMIHIGEGPHRLRPFLNIAETTDIPLSQFIPTHLNRSREVLEESVLWGKEGGYVDISAGVSSRYGFVSAVSPGSAVLQLLERGVAEDRITMSSDGNGVMTVTDPATGKHRPLIAPVRSLFEEFVQMVREGIPLETALRIVSTNAADHLRLSGKGRIMEDADADILLLHEDDFSLSSVIARGEIVFENGSVTKRGLFEEE